MASYLHTCNCVSVRLDDTNYPTWVYLMQHLLRSRGLLKFVDGSFPATNTEAYDNWSEQDSVVICLITSSLSQEALTLVIGCETSKEVWTTLKQRYAPDSEVHIMRLKSRLQCIQKGSESIYQYLLRFKDVQNHLAVVGNAISDMELKSLVLAGLPTEYAHTRQLIRSKGSITMDEVSCLLISAEFELKIEMENKARNAYTSENGYICYTQGPQFGPFGASYNMASVASQNTDYKASNMPSAWYNNDPPSTCLRSVNLSHNGMHNHLYGTVMSGGKLCTQYGGMSYSMLGPQPGLQNSLSSLSNKKDMPATSFSAPVSIPHSESIFQNLPYGSTDQLARPIDSTIFNATQNSPIMGSCQSNGVPFLQCLGVKTTSNNLYQSVESQTCEDISQPAYKCKHSQHVSSRIPLNTYQEKISIGSASTLPCSATHKALGDTLCIDSRPSSRFSQSVLNAFVSQAALPPSNNMLQFHTRDNSTMICGQAYASKNMGQSIPLIPPG